MRLIAETKGLEKLVEIQREFASEIRSGYEHKARSCAVCTTPGACCLDEHFVNVRISRLEAVAINGVLETLPTERQQMVEHRVRSAIERYKLDEAIDVATTYSC